MDLGARHLVVDVGGCEEAFNLLCHALHLLLLPHPSLRARVFRQRRIRGLCDLRGWSWNNQLGMARKSAERASAEITRTSILSFLHCFGSSSSRNVVSLSRWSSSSAWHRAPSVSLDPRNAHAPNFLAHAQHSRQAARAQQGHRTTRHTNRTQQTDSIVADTHRKPTSSRINITRTTSHDIQPASQPTLSTSPNESCCPSALAAAPSPPGPPPSTSPSRSPAATLVSSVSAVLYWRRVHFSPPRTPMAFMRRRLCLVPSSSSRPCSSTVSRVGSASCSLASSSPPSASHHAG
eukprot:3419338-Rhodomonas_salina.1